MTAPRREQTPKGSAGGIVPTNGRKYGLRGRTHSLRSFALLPPWGTCPTWGQVVRHSLVTGLHHTHTHQPPKRTRFCGVYWCALCLRVPFTSAPVGLRAPRGAHCVRSAHKCAPASREGGASIPFVRAAPRTPVMRGSV